eukprot:CAMPEP_0202877406 /NCGR_PEP_ID=MMETSP1391-20130828/30604_1 /ASSEMBLY_ACC=CAM_ASM_000867 /TAXON_ID=1034604 /ORGANISM="Chlamydomonas leiostraca, Strain SAG 11-49" /LENGTH=46 /DNA_ID= /DNA_START= /DNA_END= /DNA_ORIENTATION=
MMECNNLASVASSWYTHSVAMAGQYSCTGLQGGNMTVAGSLAGADQ